jgi:hypothetical protein
MTQAHNEHTPGDQMEVIIPDDFDLDIFEDIETAIEKAAAELPCIDISTESESSEPVEETSNEHPRKGKDSLRLRRYRERNAQGAKVAFMKFMDGIKDRKTIKEAAIAAGVHPHYAYQHLWPKLKALNMTDWYAPEERERIAGIVADSLLHVLKVAVDNVGEHAAYGAVAISAAKELRDTFGLDLTGKVAGEGKTDDLEALGEQIRAAMPALMGHHEHIARIKQRQLEKQGLALSGEAAK